MTKTLEAALRWVVITGAFILPFVCLIVATSLYFPYITGKNFTFRIVVELMTAAWLALALIEPKYRPRRSWILGAFSVFVLIMAIADAQGVMPFKSFWSNFERMDGWVTLAHLLAYLAVVISVLNTEKLWRWLFRVSLAVSAWVAIYGFFQIAGDLALGQPGGSGFNARIDATFGNPIYLAIYMLFHIFIAALLWLQQWNESPQGKRLWWSLGYGAIIVADTVALLFTGTRGATLGLIGGAFLAFIIFAFRPGGSKRLRTATAGLFVLGALFAGSLWLARDTYFVKHVGFLDRLASISLTDSTVHARFLNMGIALQGVKEKPLLGWGQENYAIVFDKYYDPRMYGQEPWFDRVHNIIFDWWVTGGTLGLLAYLSIFAALLWVLWRPSEERGNTQASTPNARKGTPFSIGERAILTGLFAGYFIHNLTVFDNITSYILFATVLGYIAWRSGEARQAKRIVEAKFLPDKALWATTLVALALAIGSVWWLNTGAIAQNHALIAAIQPRPAAQIQTSLDDFQKALSYGSLGTQETREQLIQVTASLASSQDVTLDTKKQFFELAANQMLDQAKASPMDARFPFFLGVLFSSYGDYPDALTALQQAHSLTPGKQAILFALAQVQQLQGDTQAALASLKTAYELDTDITEARDLYAAAAISAGQDSLADSLLQPVIANGGAADARVAAAYASRKEFSKIITIWEAAIQASPSNGTAYLTLAAAYYEQGQSAKAISIIRDAEAKVPSIKTDGDKLIQEIQQGVAGVTQ